MNVWDDFNRLSTLKIKFSDNFGAKTAEIFSNGRNMVPITIEVAALNSDGKLLATTNSDLLPNLELINSNSSQPISSPWHFTDKRNDFSNAFQYYNSRDVQPSNVDAKSSQITFYVYATSFSDGIDLAVRLNVPGVGYFDTTEGGTTTINGPAGSTGGSVFKSPSAVHVKTRTPIDYSRGIENLTVSNMPTGFGSLEHVVHDMEWDGDFVGTSSKASVSIYTNVTNASFVKVSTNGGWVKQKFNFAGNGCADMLYGATGDNYDIQVIFVNKESYGLLADNDFDMTGGRYVIGDHDDRHHWTVPLPNDAIRVDICNHRIPNESDVHQSGWHDDGIPQNVDVTDSFGNQSTIKLSTDNSTWPGFYVNGHRFK